MEKQGSGWKIGRHLVSWWYSTAVDELHLPQSKASDCLAALKVPVEPIEASDFFLYTRS